MTERTEVNTGFSPLIRLIQKSPVLHAGFFVSGSCNQKHPTTPTTKPGYLRPMTIYGSDLPPGVVAERYLDGHHQELSGPYDDKAVAV
jgi:hypothetical protein